MAVLAAENVSYTYQSKYQKVQALKNVSCTFEAGKFYAIVGQSGSGKTTLLSMLAGLGTPSEGEIIVNGKTLKEIGSERHRRENVTVIYQSFNLLPTLNILENVMYPMQISKKPTKEAKIKAKEQRDIILSMSKPQENWASPCAMCRFIAWRPSRSRRLRCFWSCAITPKK